MPAKSFQQGILTCKQVREGCEGLMAPNVCFPSGFGSASTPHKLEARPTLSSPHPPARVTRARAYLQMACWALAGCLSCSALGLLKSKRKNVSIMFFLSVRKWCCFGKGGGPSLSFQAVFLHAKRKQFPHSRLLSNVVSLPVWGGTGGTCAFS